MLIVVAMMAAIWGGGALLGAPRAQRWMLLAILLFAVIGVTAFFPEGHGLRGAFGGSAAPYLLLLGFAVVGLAYGNLLRRLKRRADARGVPQDTKTKQGTFTSSELERYARHIVLREIGGPGQKKLKSAKVLVIGAGGLGAPVLQYLAAAGVGTIGVIDDDIVENANLQRQVIHTDTRIGMPKVFSAQIAVQDQNPHVELRPFNRRLTDDSAKELFADFDVILDGTDNFDTRYLANQTAHALGKPLISGALSQWEGQVSVFDTASGTPCYQCIFPQAPAEGLAPSCAEAGVIGPLPGVVGSMMALEAIKLITGAGASLRGEMLIYDGLYGETRKLTLKPRGDCPICGPKETP